jgi:hypothetical protein
MLKTKTMVTVLVLSLAATSAALAKDRATRPGYDANAQAIGSALEAIGPELAARADALRHCKREGGQQTARYRACMAEHGQPK